MAAALLNACSDGAAPLLDAPAQFITAKRAWLPGERDTLIARIIRDRGFSGIPYLGDISDLAPQIYNDVDSVVTIIPNPAFQAVASAWGVAALSMPPAFDGTWTIVGMDVRNIDTTQTPADTTDYLGAFWAKSTESSWKGIALAYRCSNRTGGALASCQINRTPTTSGAISVNTTAFETALHKAGAGAGEFRLTTGEYWQGTSGNILVSAASYGAAATVTTGPYLGGTSASGTMQGRLQSIVMPRLLPSAVGSITVDLDFRVTAISAVMLTCLFRSPCTTNSP